MAKAGRGRGGGSLFLLTVAYDDIIIVIMKDPHARRRRRLQAQLRAVGPVLKGSLADVELTCGTPGCRCHKKGPKHKGLYFSYRHGGRSHTIYVPKAMQRDARTAHAKWLELKGVLEDLTALEVRRLRGGAKGRRTGRKERG